jgi:hypothetical protein
MKVMRCVWGLSLLTVLALLCNAAQGGEGGYDLRWQFRKGRKLTYKISCKSTMSVNAQKEEKIVCAGTITITCGAKGAAFLRYEIGKPKDAKRKVALLGPNQVRAVIKADGSIVKGLPREQQNFILSLFPVPGKKVGIGDKWAPKIQLAKRNRPATKTTAVLKDISRTGLRGSHVFAEIELSYSAMSVPGAAVTMGNGRYRFDVKRKCFVWAYVVAGMTVGGPGKVGKIRVVTELKLTEDKQLDADAAKEAESQYVAWVQVYKALDLAAQGKVQNALKACAEAQKAKPDAELASVIAAQIHAEKGEFDKAITCIKKERKDRPNGKDVKLAFRRLLLCLAKLPDKGKRDTLARKLRVAFPDVFKKKDAD